MNQKVARFSTGVDFIVTDLSQSHANVIVCDLFATAVMGMLASNSNTHGNGRKFMHLYHILVVINCNASHLTERDYSSKHNPFQRK